MVHVIYDFSTNFLYVNGLGDYLIFFAFPLFRARLKKKRVMGKFDRPRLSLQTVGGRVSLLSLLPPCHITLRILPFSSIEVRDILQFVFFSLVILRTSDNNYISVNNACTMYTVRESEMSTVFNRFLSSGQYFHVRLIAPPLPIVVSLRKLYAVCCLSVLTTFLLDIIAVPPPVHVVRLTTISSTIPIMPEP